ADSTSWCLLFLSETEVLGQESLGRGLSFLKRHQSPSDGGFRTYAEPREIGRYMMLDEQTSFEGWASSQPCVTAAAAQALTKTGSLSGSAEAFDYIRRAQTPEGGWNAYWWTDPLYSTLLCMEALTVRGREEDRPALERARGWIARSQLATGGWFADGWAFSTGLALSGLLLGPPSPDYLAALQRGVEWLLATQLEDGSWGEHHILRIPHPSAKEPWTQTDWTIDGKAINAAIRDQRRLYTTATVFKALSEYWRKTSEGWQPQRSQGL
ncbi:MAG TPA: prenyltransferase/squalene oxidase repeat-containing protein, partial [Nitrososphaerales archaeon]|nr:prenyltransferase/squalene oxidase repeat-containing protein [Nitrososphaerales archaeon]